MARELTVYGFTCGILAVPAGASLAVFVKAATGEVSSTLKYFSGGSLEIIGASLGNTYAISAGTGYLLSANEAINIDGAATYFLCATGSTAVAYFAKGLSQGY